MISILPSQTADLLEHSCPYRKSQLQQLALYYNQYLPSPPVLVAYGLEDVGRLESILALLTAAEFDHALVRSRECLSQRHLLAKIFVTCVRSLGYETEIERFDRIDSLNALSVNLQKLFGARKTNFALVIDGIEKQKGASQTLLPALARLGDIVPGLSVILTTSGYRALPLHRSGVPYVHFPPYTRTEAILIVQSKPPRLLPTSVPEDFPSTEASKVSGIYNSFVRAVYDTISTHTSSTSLSTFQRTCEKLWPRFIWPMFSGEPMPGHTQTTKSDLSWDFARLLSRNRPLFQAEGEKALTEKLFSRTDDPWTFTQLVEQHQRQRTETHSETATYAVNKQLSLNSFLPSSKPIPSASAQTPSTTLTATTPLLKFFPTLLFLSSYLASHTPPKHDIILFSRLSSSSSHKRKYLSSALNKNKPSSRVRKTPTKPKQASSTSANDSNNNNNDTNENDNDSPAKRRDPTIALATTKGTTPSKEKTHKSTRLQFEKTSNIPKPFTLERVVAILRAIHPDGLSRNKGAADRVYGEMVELERLRMVLRLGTGSNAGGGGASSVAMLGASAPGGDGSMTGSNGAGPRGNDDGILEEKWRINVGRDVVVEMGRRWGIGLEGWEID